VANADRIGGWNSKSQVKLCEIPIGWYHAGDDSERIYPAPVNFRPLAAVARCFQHQGDGFVQVGTGFFECRTLGVGARQLLDERDVALRDAAKNCGELKIHVRNHTPGHVPASYESSPRLFSLGKIRTCLRLVRKEKLH